MAAAAVGAAVGIPGVKRPLTGLFAAAKSDMITATVRPGKLAVIVKERGSLESAANKDVFCEVEGGTTIIRILPEGSRVKEGEIVCWLDSAALKDSLVTQKISTSQAEASFRQAKLTREVAEYAVKEYIEGVYKQDYETAMGDLALARADLTRAGDRMKWSTEMEKKGYVPKASATTDKLSFDKAKFALEQAQTQLDVLQKYTRDKQIKSLNSDVEKARADELSKESSFKLEETKEKKLERQIEKCVLKAPGDGIVVYANDPNKFGGQQQLQVEDGASVRERQKIFSLPDITKMRVNTKVHESMIKSIRAGLRSLIRVEAAAGQELHGSVASLAPMADSGSFFSSDIKVYTTYIAIEDDTSKLNLRPGMNAQVEILVSELDNVLSVPVMAILQFKGKDHVFVREGEGFRRTEVTLGTSNDQHVEIQKGLQAGDVVALAPVTLLSDEERREAFSGANRDASKKNFGEGKASPGGEGAGPGPGPGGEGAGPGGEGKAKGKRGGGMGGMMGGPLGEKFMAIPDEDKAKLRSASPEERAEIFRKAGFTEEEIQQAASFGGGRGGRGGPGGEGRRRGGPGGGGEGGPGGGSNP